MVCTFNWCQDKTKLTIWDKQVFSVSGYGTKYWFLNGKYCTETTYWKKLKRLKRLDKLKILNEWCLHLIGVKIKLN